MKNKYGQLEIKDSIAVIWLDMEDSPQNIISPEMISYVNPFLKEVAENKEIKGAVLISKKKDFIAGADIKFFDTIKAGEWQAIGRNAHNILDVISSSTKPVIAAIDGACLGAGLEIALACQGCICSNAQHTKLALPPASSSFATYRVPTNITYFSRMESLDNPQAFIPNYSGLLGDKRLEKRAAVLFSKLSLNPSSSIQRLSSSKAEQKANYRLLNNHRVEESQLIAEACCRVKSLVEGRHVLCLQDTCEINLSSHKGRLKPNTGLGRSDKPGSAHCFKLIIAKTNISVKPLLNLGCCPAQYNVLPI